MIPRLVSVLAGNIFATSDARGDIEASPGLPVGLFSFDTRYLSTWVLTLNGQRLNALSRDEMHYYEARFFLVPGAPTHYVDADVSVIRHRSVGASMEERLVVLNHSREPADFTVRMDIASDFADESEQLTPSAPRPGTTTAQVVQGELRLRYERGPFKRETVVTANQRAEVDEAGMTFRVTVPPHDQWLVDLHVDTVIRGSRGRDLRESLESYRYRIKEAMDQDMAEWLGNAPQLISEHRPLERAYRRSLVDLASLRYVPLAYTGRIPVAGLPWSMTLYGRDSLLTSLQTLPFTPELAPATLHLLALLQGGQLDDFHDEEPGKILQELRYGEAAAFEATPQLIYYGAADTTPLFVILLDEYERWSGDADLVHELRHPARLALDWIDEYGDLMGDGYLWYLRRNNSLGGVTNQGWKDSEEAVCFADGRDPGFPRATCELQGYAYDAKLRGARLARRVWNDPEYADRLEREAADLRHRFNQDFWLPDRGYYALALDGQGNQVDAKASNMGHLLWSGIADPDKAARVVEHLLGPEMFSGWGIRSLARDQRRYNPVGLHLGSVWPADNSIIAMGLRRYGFHKEAGRVVRGLTDAAEMFDGRLPELFAGYERELTKYPVQLPTVGSPQSWAAGAMLMLVRAMFALEAYDEHLVVDPALPQGFGRVELLDIPGRWGRADAYGRDRPSGTPKHKVQSRR